MPDALQLELLTPEQAADQAVGGISPYGIRYATLGWPDSPATTPSEIQRLVGAVPAGIAAGLSQHVYLFVPLALSGARLAGDEAVPVTTPDPTLIAPVYQSSLLEKAICHRNAAVGDAEYVFLSSRLHTDRFALAFEFFINVAHNFVDTVGTPSSFADLAWRQAATNVRGETSMDAWEDRADALGQPRSGAPPRTPGIVDEKARSSYQAAAFSDAIAIYLLSLSLDFDYADLREREYPLLAAPALAERLRAINKLFPANEGYQFQILYRRRS